MKNLLSSIRRPLSVGIFLLILLPSLTTALPVDSDIDEVKQQDKFWWEETSMDLDRDGVHDAIWLAIQSDLHTWFDSDYRISVIVDFDHLPTHLDQIMLEEEIDFETQFRYHLIHSIAGTVSITKIELLSNLPGVVMVELDGILSVQMAEVNDVHGIPMIWDETGYTGAGSVVSIIDTGIDSDHVGLDDLDDDNSTNDAKVIAFYDAVNSPELTNGTEVKAYDDQGHGTHCAGITAGTGAPTYDYVGVAPQAQLVGVKVLDSGGSGSFATVMAGMEWTVDKRHDFNIRAASMSLGGPGVIEWTSSEEESVNRMANEMMRSGIALFIAAGNAAISAQIGTPGSAEDVITVGSLDKNTAIAVYSSQGPTEEGRIKPNIAFVGSNVMAPDFNTGDGYTSKSGTSMATPGAAGLAALMYQANPDLSPFDVRNIMQETSIYRECHYMAANEPCAEDLIPKNRQNNVYGHGQVDGYPALIEAASSVYSLSLSLNLTAITEVFEDNRIYISAGEKIEIAVDGNPANIQWRTWDMRDNWMDHPDFNQGDDVVEVSHSMFADRLQYLPGNQIEGNQTLMVRAILEDSSSTNLIVHLYITESETISESTNSVYDLKFLATILGIFVIFLLIIILVPVITNRYDIDDEGDYLEAEEDDYNNEILEDN
ncbi:MAG: S8 family serine peptidase [Candidatus Poseidoniales archaeon]|jgi:subtilisin family serine protease|tara:strand:- start:1454 stop:3421 length:1968 start_codon:yes stop_codon:yes gene_type:complete